MCRQYIVARYRDRFFVRYAEVDQQGVVFNAHYMTYCDTAVDRWWRSAGLQIGQHDYDCMVVKAVLEWQGSAKYAEELDVEVHASRWGNTSFDATCVGTVGDRPIFTATLTYVGVRHGTTETMPMPDEIKAALGG
jgi:acyl-CoA thioester hydrolase